MDTNSLLQQLIGSISSEIAKIKSDRAATKASRSNPQKFPRDGNLSAEKDTGLITMVMIEPLVDTKMIAIGPPDTAQPPGLKILGLIVNLKKSQLIPAQNMEFLGFLVNSVSMHLAFLTKNLTREAQLVDRQLTLESPLYPRVPDMTINTDWGAQQGVIQTRGGWSMNKASHHINYLELLTAYLVLQCFAKQKHNITIILRMDNITAVMYINKMRGIHSQGLCHRYETGVCNRTYF